MLEEFNLGDYIEIETLDFFTKYALIITNFIIIIFLVIYNKYFKKTDDQNSEKHNILIVVSRPTDLIDYFYPTIVNHIGDYTFHVLSISSGGPDHQAQELEKEFEKSCALLEINKFHVFQDESLKSDSEKEWPASTISNKILDYIQDHKIKALISFDERGVDHKQSNVSIAKALKLIIIDEEKKKRLPETFKIYELISVNRLRKMLGIWDFLLCILQYYVYLSLNFSKLFQLTGIQKLGFAKRIKIALLFRRYSFVNTLKRIN